ncbi:MAG: hypothetical protein QM602_07155, partial [Microbacterium sp.]
MRPALRSVGARTVADPARHARRRHRGLRAGAGLGAVALAAVVGFTAALAVGTAGASAPVAAPESTPTATATPRQTPPQLVSTPLPALPCTLPDVIDALDRGDDDAVVAAMGGGAAMRALVVAGDAPCIDLSDPARIWMVVDKTRPYDPLHYTPEQMARVQDMRVINQGILRTDAGAALTRLVAAADKAGAGELAITSGYRSYDNQALQYSGRVA